MESKKSKFVAKMDKALSYVGFDTSELIYLIVWIVLGGISARFLGSELVPWEKKIDLETTKKS